MWTVRRKYPTYPTEPAPPQTHFSASSRKVMRRSQHSSTYINSITPPRRCFGSEHYILRFSHQPTLLRPSLAFGWLVTFLIVNMANNVTSPSMVYPDKIAHETTSIEANDDTFSSSIASLETANASSTTTTPNANDCTLAARTVFNTAELLEQIITYLPIRKTVCFQGVSRLWKEVIDNSPIIQTQLFLRSDSTRVISPQRMVKDPEVIRVPRYIGMVEVNPIITWDQQGTIPLPYNIAYPWRAKLNFGWYMPGVHRRHSIGNLRSVKEAVVKINRAYMHRLISSSPQESSKFDSWHRIFLTNPPVTTVTLRGPRSNSAPVYNEFDILICPGGVTLGAVKSELDKMTHKALRQIQIPQKICAQGFVAELKYLENTMRCGMMELFVVCEEPPTVGLNLDMEDTTALTWD
ncbi:hypothetical protein Q7P37_008597 [Cladosporium fusiforme]